MIESICCDIMLAFATRNLQLATCNSQLALYLVPQLQCSVSPLLSDHEINDISGEVQPLIRVHSLPEFNYTYLIDCAVFNVFSRRSADIFGVYVFKIFISGV